MERNIQEPERVMKTRFLSLPLNPRLNLPLDPRPDFVEKLERNNARVFDGFGIPDNIRDEFIASATTQTLREAADAWTAGTFTDEIDGLLSRHRQYLGRNIERARATGGRLCPLTPSSEVKRCVHRLDELLWNGFEIKSLVEVLTPADLPILEVTLRTIKTSCRVLGRDFFMELRPVSNSEAFFRNLGTPERLLHEFEQRAREEAIELARPFSSFSGPDVGRSR
jgi:hypothetical protein